MKESNFYKRLDWMLSLTIDLYVLLLFAEDKLFNGLQHIITRITLTQKKRLTVVLFFCKNNCYFVCLFIVIWCSCQFFFGLLILLLVFVYIFIQKISKCCWCCNITAMLLFSWSSTPNNNNKKYTKTYKHYLASQ